VCGWLVHTPGSPPQRSRWLGNLEYIFDYTESFRQIPDLARVSSGPGQVSRAAVKRPG